MDKDCANCPTVNNLEKRLIVVETKQENMEANIDEIKQALKENKAFVMGTLVTSLLTLLGLFAQYIVG